MDNEVYDQQLNKIDNVKLLIKSDNIATTLSNQELMEHIMQAFNDLMTSLEVDHSRQKKVLLALRSVQKKAEKKMQDYEMLLERLEQKKLYLVGFIKLYKKNS